MWVVRRPGRVRLGPDARWSVANSCCAAGVEYDFLRVLGVRVALGRDFAPEDDVRGVPRVALISHRLWVRRYGADPRVVGRMLSLESTTERVQRVPVVGVLPPDFEMPLGTADILLPFQLRPLDPAQAFNLHIMTFARLRPGVTPTRAELMPAQRIGGRGRRSAS